MYERFYGLQTLPFALTANPRFLYLPPQYREALSNLAYGITGRKGITLLVGEAGTGKSTLVRAILDRYSRDDRYRFAYVNNPALTRADFIATLAAEFGLSGEAAASKTAFLAELRALAVKYTEAGGTVTIVIDEAQSLPSELLEEIRLLTNIETDREKLVQVLMTGQPELAARLNEPVLRQLKQRVALRCALAPLAVDETAVYVATRVQVAGGQAAQLFTREAIVAIHEAARGIPRLVNVIADNALVTGFAAQVRPVGRDIVLGVCRDFDLETLSPEMAALSVRVGQAEGPRRALAGEEAPVAIPDRVPARGRNTWPPVAEPAGRLTESDPFASEYPAGQAGTPEAPVRSGPRPAPVVLAAVPAVPTPAAPPAPVQPARESPAPLAVVVPAAPARFEEAAEPEVEETPDEPRPSVYDRDLFSSVSRPRSWFFRRRSGS